MADDMDPRDKDTMKWLGNIIEVGGESNRSAAEKTATTSTLAQPPAKTPVAGLSRPSTRKSDSQSSFAQLAAIGATQGSKNSDFRASNASRLSMGSPRNSYSRLSQASMNPRSIVAAAKQVDDEHADALADPIAGVKPTVASKNPARYSRGSPDTSKPSSRQSDYNTRLENGAANAAANIASRDAVPYSVPAHKLSANAGKAALLAHRDHKEYEVSAHRLAKDAGRAATLAHKDHVEYQVPPHELSANAGKAALQAANDHVEYEVPAHELSRNASTAALRAHDHPVEVVVPVHQMSASAGSAALLAHKEPVNIEAPVHQLSASAGKAALLAHHDHEEYVIPEHELSANAGKAALLAHRDHRDTPSKPNATSAASAANALKAASQAHHDPAMRPTKPEDLQARGAASALRAASQAHRDKAPAFKYVHPADDPAVGKLARANTQKYLSDMEFKTPSQDTVAYANISYNNAKLRGSQSINYGPTPEAYKGANLSASRSTKDFSTSTALAPPISGVDTTRARSQTNTSAAPSNVSDIMALARRNVDAQMAARGMVRSESRATVNTVQSTAANRGANLAFKDGQDRAVEAEKQRQISREELDIQERIAQEMAKFDQQRKRNENNAQVQSALMEAAKRNARLSMANMEASRPYSAPKLADTARMEDLLNEEKLKARRQSNTAQVDLGGGHFMSQADVEAIAAKRIQPVFDEMDEHVAEMNRRKAELQAQKDAELKRKADEKAEKKKENDLRKERERNTKEAERLAKATRKAEEKAAADKRKAEEKAAAEERKAAAEKKRAEEKAALEAKRAEEKTALEAKRAAEKAALEEKKQAESEKLIKAGSTEAVAGARTNISAPVAAAGVKHSTSPEPITTKNAPLPGTNQPLPGQVIPAATTTASKSEETTPTLPQGETQAATPKPVVAELEAPTTESQVTTPKATDGEFRLAPAIDRSKSNEAVATYQVETKGMVTDTEGETDDEWVDASEETPAIERAEYVNIGQLTDSNLIAHAGRKKSLDPETASTATAKPTKEDVPPVPALTPAQHVFAKSNETATRFKEDLA